MRHERILCCLSTAALLLGANQRCLAQPPAAQIREPEWLRPPQRAKEANATYETVVTAKRKPRRTLPYSVEVTKTDEVERSPSRTAAQVVEGKPGISYESDGPVNGRIGIRGLARDRISLLLDGNRQLLIRNAGTDIPIDPWDVGRIEIIKGASGLSLANDAIGGVVNIVLRRPELPTKGWSKKLAFASSFSSANSEARAGARASLTEAKGKYAQVSTTARHALQNIRPAEGPRIPNSTYSLITGNLILGQKTDRSLVDLSYYGRHGISVGTYSSNIIQDPDSRHMVALKLGRRGDGLLRWSELSISYMRFDVDFNFLADDLAITKKWFIGDWNNLGVEGWTNLRVHRSHDLITGLGFFWTPTHRFQTSSSRVFVGDVFPHAARQAVGAFLQDTWALGRSLFLIGVLRLDHDRLSSEDRAIAPGSPFEQAVGLDRIRARVRSHLSLSGNLGATFTRWDPLVLRLNAGTATRPPVPGMFSVFVPVGTDAPTKPGTVCNPDLVPERSLNVEAGASYQGRGTEVDGTAFFTAIYDYLAEHTSRSLRDPGHPDYRYRTYSNQDAMLYGFELGLRQRLFKQYLVLRGAVSFAIGSYRKPIPDSPSADTDLPLVPPLRGYVAFESRPLRDLQLALRLRYAATQSRNSDAAGEEATPGYAVLDLLAAYRTRWLGDHLDLYLDILNLTDAPYREHTVQYQGIALGFERANLQPGIDFRVGLSLSI